ncbi:hypothetical protein N7463_006270 [Penicillium fimorum]|uniref:Aminoglycoside phosphotransferase domain-containing protein n=1 Tax=Penicillium fimorum TaxID=1882269 RepID=A0A9W9XV05_9EURO|nr:hypothetical protein N7463_006270 [Penicillium fimorum]
MPSIPVSLDVVIPDSSYSREYLQGQTLEQGWDSMEDDHRISICHELRKIVDAIRTIPRTRSLYDRVFSHLLEVDPFASFIFLRRRKMPEPYLVPLEPFRSELPDNSDIVFIHGDLHRSDIIVTPTLHICGIID